MKKWLPVLLALLLCGAACAETTPQDVLALWQAACPGYEAIAQDMWGNTAAAVMAMEEKRVLCVAENIGGTWQLTVENPTALRQGETPQLLLDSDNAIFWRYDEDDGATTTYHCTRDGAWGEVSCKVQAVGPDGMVDEAEHVWRDGRLHRSSWIWDENENLLHTAAMPPVPALWLANCVRLETFDAQAFPLPNLFYTEGWLNQKALAGCAQELAPGCTLIRGEATDEGVELFVEKPDGRRVLVCARYQDGAWMISESLPLPEGTLYGYENFSECLYLSGSVLAAVSPHANGWGLDYILSSEDGGMVCFGPGWVADGAEPDGPLYPGDHPWSDLSAIDWQSLPVTLAQARAGQNVTFWAQVNNPNPADRLHLRVQADRGAASLGKYYNGTPVRVLERRGDWARVEVCGVSGWMMEKYLAFGQEMDKVLPAFPSMTLKENAPRFLYERARQDAACREISTGTRVVIVGLAGEKWFHVWLPEEDRAGYMLQSDFWAGNG